MANKWFDEVFLPSLIERSKNNPAKYQNRVILSDKQFDICLKNMTKKECHGDYGYFEILAYETSTHKFQADRSGRYNFLYITAK